MPASLARPVGSQFLYLPLCPQRKFGLAPTPLRLCKTPVGVPSGTAEAGDSANRYFLRPKLGRDLPMTAAATRRSAVVQLTNQLSGAPTRNNGSDRAPREIIPDKLIVYRVDFLLRRGARTLRVFYWPAGCNLHCPRAGGYWPNNASCLANILLQQSRAGCRSAPEPGCVYPNKGPRRDANASAAGAVPSGTRYGPFGREKPCDHSEPAARHSAGPFDREQPMPKKESAQG